MDYALRIRDVTKRFGAHTAVDGLTLDVPKGCIFGFLGQNGAGKTTTIRMVMSIFKPDSGSIEVLGQPDAALVKDRLGYLPEEKGLYKKMKTAEIVAYFGKLKGMSPDAADRKARALLTEYGLGDWIDKKCEAMSKGMGQKVQLLGTLIHEPELVILDEPFSGLDPVNRDVMRDTILRMKREGRTVIFSTHVMDAAERMCDAVAIIARGEVVANGSLGALKAEFGGQGRVSIQFGGDGRDRARELLSNPALVARLDDHGQQVEVDLVPGVTSQQLLEALVANHVELVRFDRTEASLHRIFLEKVGATGVEPGVSGHG